MPRIAWPLSFSKLVLFLVWLDRSIMVSTHCALCADARSGAGKSSHIFCLDSDGLIAANSIVPFSGMRCTLPRDRPANLHAPLRNNPC